MTRKNLFLTLYTESTPCGIFCVYIEYIVGIYAVYLYKLLFTMKIDANRILEKHRTKDDREKTSLYLSKSLYERFKKACGTAPVSRVIEDLMQSFLDNLESKSDSSKKA